VSHRRHKNHKTDKMKNPNDEPFFFIDLPFLPWLDEIPLDEEFLICPHCGDIMIEEK